MSTARMVTTSICPGAFASRSLAPWTKPSSALVMSTVKPKSCSTPTAASSSSFSPIPSKRRPCSSRWAASPGLTAMYSGGISAQPANANAATSSALSELRRMVGEIAHAALLVVLHDHGQRTLRGRARARAGRIDRCCGAGGASAGCEHEGGDAAAALGVHRLGRDAVVNPHLAPLLVGGDDIRRAEHACDLRARHPDPDLPLHLADGKALAFALHRIAVLSRRHAAGEEYYENYRRNLGHPHPPLSGTPYPPAAARLLIYGKEAARTLRFST